MRPWKPFNSSSSSSSKKQRENNLTIRQQITKKFKFSKYFFSVFRWSNLIVSIWKQKFVITNSAITSDCRNRQSLRKTSFGAENVATIVIWKRHHGCQYFRSATEHQKRGSQLHRRTGKKVMKAGSSLKIVKVTDLGPILKTGKIPFFWTRPKNKM